MGGVNFKINGQAVDTLVVTGNARRFNLNFTANLRKVVVTLARDMQKLTPFLILTGLVDAGVRVDLGRSGGAELKG